MSDIIKFEKPKEKSLEDKFMETLSLYQMEMFAEIMLKARIDQDEREEKFIKKIIELESKLNELKK